MNVRKKGGENREKEIWKKKVGSDSTSKLEVKQGENNVLSLNFSKQNQAVHANKRGKR